MTTREMYGPRVSLQEIEAELELYGISVSQFVEVEGVRDSYPSEIVTDWVGY